MRLYCFRDKKIDTINRVDVFVSDLVAYREYDLQLQKFKLENPFINEDDYEVVFLGELDKDFNISASGGIVITKDYILEELANLPILNIK